MIVTFEIDTDNPTLSETDVSILNILLGNRTEAKPAMMTDAERAETNETPTVVDEKPTEEPDADLMDLALARASLLMSNGERPRVLKALKKAGASKVSALSAEALPVFIKELSD